MAETTVHFSVSGSIEPDEDGWHHAHCQCGYKQGPFPDVETVVDHLMDHATACAREEWRPASSSPG